MRFIFIALVIAVLQVRITVAEERSSWLESKIQGKRFGGSVSVNQSIAEGIRLGARYKAESAPSYFPKFYTRIDQYSINADLLPGQVLSRSSGLPVGLGFSSGTEVTFARQFEKQLDSIKATPYGYDHLPFTAKTAREKLIAGDYVSFSSKMNLSGSVNSFVPAFGMLGGGAGAQLVASGEFQIQIFRMRNDLVRVRIISNRGNAKNLYAGVSAMPAFNLFQISMANSATNKLISALAPVNPLQVNMENGAEHLIVLDYVYDLSHADAAFAYDRLMAGKLLATSGEAAHLLHHAASSQDRESVFLNDLGPSEALVARDRDLLPNYRAVDRIFQAKNDSHFSRGGVHLDLKVVNFGDSSTFTEEKITVTDRKGAQARYVFESVKEERESQAFLGRLSRQEGDGAGILLKASADFSVRDPAALILTHSFRTSRYDQDHTQQLFRQLRRLLPDDQGERVVTGAANALLAEINREVLHDLSLNMEIAFDVHQAAKFLALSSSELRKEMEQYLRVKHGKAGREGLIYDGQAYPQMETRVPGARRSAFCKLLVCFGRDLDAISEHLSRGLRSDLSVHERLKEFQALERFPIFREISSGFLISLLPPDGFRNLYQVRIELIARGKSPFVFEEGHISEEDTLRKFQLAQDLLNNRSIDIRLYRGSDGESSLTREAGFNETMPDSLPEAHVAQ